MRALEARAYELEINRLRVQLDRARGWIAGHLLEYCDESEVEGALKGILEGS